eukprot:67549_1
MSQLRISEIVQNSAIIIDNYLCESNHQFIMQHTDWEIIGFIISAYCGCLVIPLFLCDALRNMLNNKTIRNRMKYPAIISLSAGLLFCILVGFVRSTFLFKTLDFGYHT